MPAKHIVYKGGNLRLGKTEILRLIEHMVSLDQNNQGVNEMKQYKVGDTIYVKGKITDVDHNETMLPYCVVSSPNYHFWASQEAIVDELPTAEPVKPVLPKDVADEISYAKSIKDVTFDDYIIRELIYSGHDDSATKTMIQSPDVPKAMEALLDAWNNGWEVE